MVPLEGSERRHRLHSEEVPEVIEGLRLHLQAHLEKRQDLLRAAVAFRAFYRLVTYQVGRPEYPKLITWSLIESWLNGTISWAESPGGDPEPGDEEGLGHV